MTFKAIRSVPRRIHIIGGPGSGKTTLARQLGPCLGLPVYHLDEVAFEGHDFTKRPLAARLADVCLIAAQSNWITEGIFLGWTDDLLRAADMIVWLDCVSWYGAVRRIVTRFVRLSWQGFANQPGVRKFTRYADYVRHLRQFIEVLNSSHRYYRTKVICGPVGEPIESRVATAQLLIHHHDKVIHCRTANEIQMFVASLRDIAGDIPAG
jgi:adenylate kinase family enzyme